jgi:hypothetical protein
MLGYHARSRRAEPIRLRDKDEPGRIASPLTACVSTRRWGKGQSAAKTPGKWDLYREQRAIASWQIARCKPRGDCNNRLCRVSGRNPF